MFQRLFRLFKPTQMGYTPVRHSFFRDEAIADRLHKEGYCVVDFIDEQQQELLKEVYAENHRLEAKDGGAFFGIFSKDTVYRHRVNEAINKILHETFEQWFVRYKSAVNTFVIKVPGQSSFIPIHQDGAAIDELKHSSINIWIPLQDITLLNGALQVIPRSHHIFLPYRCASVAPLQMNIEQELYPYFQPIYLKLGQALFFDSRMFHYSAPNLSPDDRVAVVCRICPQEAPIVAYYKDNSGEKGKVEMWECPSDYLITSDGYNDNVRPEGCKLVKSFRDDCPPLTAVTFELKRNALGITANSTYTKPALGNRNFIQEPNIKN
jgi:ectoine hydroxylase-related dioxygenase (phytanoyl-CoA dioxygenase family)